MGTHKMERVLIPGLFNFRDRKRGDLGRFINNMDFSLWSNISLQSPGPFLRGFYPILGNLIKNRALKPYFL